MSNSSHAIAIKLFLDGVSVMVFHTRSNMLFKRSIHTVDMLKDALHGANGIRIITK